LEIGNQDFAIYLLPNLFIINFKTSKTETQVTDGVRHFWNIVVLFDRLAQLASVLLQQFFNLIWS